MISLTASDDFFECVPLPPPSRSQRARVRLCVRVCVRAYYLPTNMLLSVFT